MKASFTYPSFSMTYKNKCLTSLVKCERNTTYFKPIQLTAIPVNFWIIVYQQYVSCVHLSVFMNVHLWTEEQWGGKKHIEPQQLS